MSTSSPHPPSLEPPEFSNQTAEIPVEAEAEPKPAMVIQLYSWATPIVALLMLIIGLAAGFLIRPIFDPSAPPSAAVAAGQATPSMMDFLVDQTQHFIGDPNAPVTMIEISDFQ